MREDPQISSERAHKSDSPPFSYTANPHGAFTLIELLVVIGIIGILAALIFPALSLARNNVRSGTCMNRLHQTGLAMQMYVSDHNIYPGAFRPGPPFMTWADQLASYNPLNWTNLAWHCPTYLAEGGNIVWQPPPIGGGRIEASSSYAYNAFGLSGPWIPRTNIGAGALFGQLGLGNGRRITPENRVVAPSEMYAVGDNRPFQLRGQTGFDGWVEMRPWRWPPDGFILEAKPPHSGGYNLLFAEGHVSLVKRQDYLFPPRSAPNWNRDNQPHPELYGSTKDWAVQN